MNDVAALKFTQKHAQPIPADRREELLATPGFGSTFSDHMVTVRWSAELGWHDACVGPLAALSLHPATMALHYGQTIFEGVKAFWRPNGQRALFRPADHARRFNSSARRMALGCRAQGDTASICGRS
jgi:branched-chain amino acid aminotransferase